MLDKYYIKVDKLEAYINYLAKNYLTHIKSIVSKEIIKLDSLSPLKTLTRGYSVVSKNNKVIKSKTELKTNDEIKITLSDGDIFANIK